MELGTSGRLTVRLVESAREREEHIVTCREMPGDVGGDVDLAGAALPTRRLFTAYIDGRPVGVASVDLPNREIALRDGSCLGLPFGLAYKDEALAEWRVAQLNYLAVLPIGRGGLVAQTLLDACAVEVLKNGAFLLLRETDLETDDAGDASRVMRQIEARGYVDRALSLPERQDGPSRAVGPGRHPLYTGEQRRLADAGEFAGVPLPHSVHQVRCFDAIFVGEPRLNRAGRYTAPVVGRIPAPSLLGPAASGPPPEALVVN